MNKEKKQLLKALNNKLEELNDFFTNKARDESRGNASCFLNLQNQYGEEFLKIQDSFLDEAIEELTHDSYIGLNFNEKIDILKPEQIKEFIEYLDYKLESEVSRELFKYINQGFSKREVEQIRLGLKKGLDVSKYANPKFNWSQMAQIRWGLEAGIDVKEYADPKIHWSEMEEIKKEIEEKSKKGIYWHKIIRRTPTEEEKEFYNYKNTDTIIERLPDYGEEVLVTNGKSVWVDSFDEDENGIYLSGTENEVNDVCAWAEIEMPNFNSLAESGTEGTTT